MRNHLLPTKPLFNYQCSKNGFINKNHLIRVLLFVFFLFPAYIGISQTVQTYNTSTTWLCPVGVTSIQVECWGAGGAGGGATGNRSAGGGGAGGSYVKNTALTVIPGTTYTINVGTGGVGSTNAGANGNDSWFNNTSTVLAKGGLGGDLAAAANQTAAGAVALATGNIGFTSPFNYYGGAGGTGGSGGASGGGGGSSAGTGSNGNNASGLFGGAAVTGGGAGVNGSTSSMDGVSNTNLGGGGAGGRTSNNTDRSGGSGGDGKIILTFTQPSCPASTAVTSSATQTGCIGFAANTLSANITLAGSSGSPTLLYQWYYNTSNSNTIAGATLIAGATSSLYTPSTAIAGTRYYFCVGYATNNNCSQTDATQSLASNTVQITVNSSNCPVSTAITPAATQSGCVGFAASTLTANITLAGICGTPALLYQWYYNTMNSNTVAGATLIAGATSSTYTASTGVVGTRFYFCVGYATNNNCSQTNATQSLASNTVQVSVNAGMSGTYLVGAGQTYTTLTAAVNAYNSSCLAGAVTFVLTSASYAGSETFPITINANGTASAINKLTIKPNTGITPTISGSVSSNGLIRILGDFVSIDGSNNGSTTRNLTITNTSTTGPSVILIGSSGTVPVNNVTLKNCIVINGTQNASAILISDAGTPGSAGYFNDITIQNNSVQKASNGIYAKAVNVGVNGSGYLVTENDLTASGANAIRRIGIYVQDIFGAMISNNTIGNFESATTEFDYGIWFASGTKNSTISGNTITNLAYTGASNTGPNGIFISTNTYNSFLTIINNNISGISSTGWVPSGGAGAASGINIDFASAGGDVYGNIISNIRNSNAAGYGCNGIQLASTATNAAFNVYNNFIFDIASTGSTASRSYDRNGHGIVITDGGGYNIYNNSILLNTNQANSGYPSSINITSGVTVAASINIKNNLFINTQTQTGDRFAIQSGAANTVFATIDYNDYYTTGANLGYIGSNRSNLAAVQTGFGGNVNSLNILPVFVSSTDLHIQTSPVLNEALNNLGNPVAGITTDIDGQTRNSLTPDMGADEFLGRGSWLGTTSTSWNSSANWFDAVIPTATTNIEIGPATFMPVISSTTQAAKNIDIEFPGTLTVSGTGVLQISGNIANNGTFNASNGTIEMNGTVAQTIPAGAFQNYQLKNLIISNTNAATGVTLAGALDIYRSLTFSASGLKLTTGGFLTFKSTNTETAWLGNMTGKTISGAATVERYIPNHAKAWQFLAVPTTGQTVNAAWQEGNAPLAVGTSGLGTIITNNVAGAGFDIIAGLSPSIKSYDSATKKWVGIPNTNVLIDNQKGYMLFVRGDRSVQNTSAPATATNLRTKGTLYTPANPPAVVNMSANTLQSVGNPYPSAIDLTLLSRSGGVQDLYYVWDPKLTTSPSAYGLGGFQTFARSGATYIVTPGGGSYPSGNCKTIESGQAFFIRALSSPGSLSFTETCKTSGSNNVNRAPIMNVKQMRTNLLVIKDENAVLIDGNLVQYDNSYSNNIDMDDAIKISNSGENLGISRNNYNLVVERRANIQSTDTIFYNLGQMRVQQYQLNFIPEFLYEPGLEAFLEDSYLRTSQPISLKDPSSVSFNVINAPASYAPNRFRLVFRRQKQPVITASAETYYRNMGSVNLIQNGQVQANETLKQLLVKKIPGISVFPNPVTNRTLQLHFTSQVPGNYKLQIFNNSGQIVYNGNVQIEEADVTKSIKLNDSMIAGSYQVTVISPAGVKSNQQVIVQ